MKKVLLILLFLNFSTIIAQDNKINWLSIEEVEVLQQKEPRKVLMDDTLHGAALENDDENTFTNKDVINYVNNNFYAVKFDAESGEDNFKELHIKIQVTSQMHEENHLTNLHKL